MLFVAYYETVTTINFVVSKNSVFTLPKFITISKGIESYGSPELRSKGL